MVRARVMLLMIIAPLACTQRTPPSQPTTSAPKASPRAANSSTREPEATVVAPPTVEPATPEPITRELTPEIAALPFAPLLRLPLALTYAVGDAEVTCRFRDAGIPGSDVDFRVECDPIPPHACHERTQVMRSAPSFWHREGCYVARPRGLYYFAECPSTASAATKGGVRMLSARMLDEAPPTGKHVIEDIGWLAREDFVIGDETITAVCRTEDTGAAGHGYSVKSCVSPKYGYLARYDEVTRHHEPPPGWRTECKEESQLVRIELLP